MSLKNSLLIIKILLIMAVTMGAERCRIEKIVHVVDVSENTKRVCVIGIWPAASKDYKMTEKGATRFLINAQNQLGAYRSTYKGLRATRSKIPKACKIFLRYEGTLSSVKYRNQCMVPWAKNTLKAKKTCKAKDTYVIGTKIKTGTADVHVVKLDKPGRFANKKKRTVKGRDLNRLAKNVGRAIRKELR